MIVTKSTLNELPQVDETPLPEDAELTQFVNALGLDGASVTCNEGNGFVACDLPASGKDTIYDESQNAIIYGENLAPGLVGRVFDAVSNWISSIVGNNDADAQPLDTSFINRAENIHDFYLSKEEDHEIRAIKLVEPGKAGIIAEFENYNTYLCPYINQYVANENPPIPDLRGQLIEEDSNNPRLCCAKEGSIQTIQAFVPTAEASAIHDFWPNLTGKLRIENDPPTGSPEHGDDPVCEVPSFPNPLDAIEPPTAIEATQDDITREQRARRDANRRAAANQNGEPADEPEQPAAQDAPAQDQPAASSPSNNEASAAPAPQAEPAPAPVPAPAPAPEPTPEPEPTPREQTINVAIENLQYTPATIRVNRGDQVTLQVKNRDDFPHTFTSSLGSAQIAADGSGSVRFTPERAGTFEVTCQFHSNMHAQIIVS